MAFTTHDSTKELMGALSTLHLSGRYSDLTVTCNNRSWAVHKAILCSRSGFFDGACGSNFREASSGVIDLGEDDEEAVDQLIQYFYYLDYLQETERPAEPSFRHRAISDARRRAPKKLDLSQIEDPLMVQAGLVSTEQPLPTPPQRDSFEEERIQGKRPRSPTKSRASTPPLEADQASESSDDESELEFRDSHLLLHTKVYALAEKLDVPGLKELAKSKFEMAMACHYDSPEFADAIEEVFYSTVDSDRGLRDVVLQAFRSHPQLASTQDVFEVIKNTPTLALELFKIERGIPI